MIFPGEFSKLWCACFISIFIESSEIIRDTRRGASQSNWGLGVVGVTWLQEVESNSGGKPGKQTTNFGVKKLLWQWQPWAWTCKKVACLLVVVRWVLVLFLWKNWLSIFGSHAGLFLVYFFKWLVCCWFFAGRFFRRPPTGTAGSGREPVVSSCTVGRVQAPGETNSVSLGPTHRILWTETNPMDDSKTNGLMCLLGTTATKPCFQLLYWRESHIWRCQARSSPERGGPLDFLPLKVSTARWTQNQGFRAEDLVDDTRNLCNTVVSLCSDK